MGVGSAAAAGRPVVDAIVDWNRGRKPELLRMKYARMGADMFAFFRGTDHLFAAEWPALRPVDPGPSILICGDLHLENFGAFRSDDGSFAFDINDFDEATVAPCSIDLVRCATSILLAAQVWGLTPIQAMRTVLGYVDRYRATIAEAALAPEAAPADSGPLEDLVGRCALGTQAELLDHLTRVDKSGNRTIQRSSGKFPPIGRAKAELIARAVEEHGRARDDQDAFRVLDVAGRIAGIGSLGVRRYIALVVGDGSPDGDRLLDIKEAGPSSLAGCSDGPRPQAWADDARRVVDAQRRLQERPTAGLVLLDVDGRAFRSREMIPDENRSRLDQLRRKPAKLRRAVEVAGRITARSHLRGAGLDEGDRTPELVRWAAGPGLDAVLASAVRFADRARDDFKAFKKAGLEREG